MATKYYIAPSVTGNQHSKYPTGNFVPAPTAIVSSVSGSDVTLTFTDNTRGYGTHVLRRASSPAGPYSDVATLSPGVTTHTITGAATGWHHYQITAYYGGLPSAASETLSVGVGVSTSGAIYRFTPPAIGSREFQAVSIPTTGLDTGTGTGQRYVITFAGNDGYLLLCPPSSPINGTVDIETNAQTVVIHGAEFLPDYAVEKVTGPAGNKTVGKVLDIVTTGANNPEIYMYKSLWRTTDDNGRVVWNAGDPINVGGYQSADNTRWPTVYMEQNWIDDLYGFAADTVGHTDCIKSNSGPVKGFRIARNRWGCSYQFFILFQSHNETYGAYPGGTNEFHDNQWYSIDTPTSWAEPIANSLYLSTSYTNQVSNGFYHAYKFNGTGAGGLNGYGTYIDMSGNHQDGNLGGIMSPPVGYGFQLSGSDLVAISGQPPTNRNNDMDWVQGTVYNGTHPKLNDISTRDRPVMRSETGSAYRITTREQLEAIISASDTTPNAFTFTDQTGVALSTAITSAAITVSGINAPASISSSGGTFDINSSGTFISSGTVNNGDTVRARVTSSSSNSTAANCVVTIGGVSDTFTVTTVASSSFTPDVVLTFEGTNGAAVGNIAIQTYGKLSTTYAGGYGSKYSNAQTRAGRSTSMEMSIPSGSDGDPAGGSTGTGKGLWGFNIDLPASMICQNGDVLHSAYWMFFPSNFDSSAPGAHLKFLRYTSHLLSNLTGPGGTVDANAVSNGRLDHLIDNPEAFDVSPFVTHGQQQGWMINNEYDNQAVYLSPPVGSLSTQMKSTRVIPRGSWALIETRVKWTATASQAEEYMWINRQFAFKRIGSTLSWINESGTLVSRTITASKTLTSASYCIANLMMFTYWNSNSPQTQSVWLDKLALAKNPASLPDSDEYGNPMMGNAI